LAHGSDALPARRHGCAVGVTPVERVVFLKGALNCVGYVIASAPGLMLYMMPTTESARRNARTRIDLLIDATPAVRDRVTKARSRSRQQGDQKSKIQQQKQLRCWRSLGETMGS
jgi:phage terminase large subunit GpA-like protein